MMIGTIVVAFIGGGGGIIVLVIVLLYCILFFAAVIGGPIFLLLTILSIRRRRRRRAWLFGTLFIAVVLPAPTFYLYVSHTFAAANQANHERAVFEAAERERQLEESLNSD